MEETIFSTKQLSAYLPGKPHIETIKRWVNAGTIPYMPRVEKKGVPIFFKKSEIDKWIENGRKL